MNIYDSIIEAVEEYGLTAQERGQLYTAVIDYLYWGREPTFRMAKAPGVCYAAMHPVLEKQKAKQDAGRIGGTAKQGAKQTAKQTASKPQANSQANAKQTPSEQEQEQELEKDAPNGASKKTRPRFVPPTVDEVLEYARSKGWDVDAEAFVAYYGSQGWRKANGQPVTNWKLAVANWRKNDSRFGRRAASEAPDFSAYEVLPEEVG